MVSLTFLTEREQRQETRQAQAGDDISDSSIPNGTFKEPKHIEEQSVVDMNEELEEAIEKNRTQIKQILPSGLAIDGSDIFESIFRNIDRLYQ